MNPDYRKQQIDPDGLRGHKERSKIDKEIQRSTHIREFEPSERITNKYSSDSIKDLELEIRREQCSARNEMCFQDTTINGNCLICNRYTVR